MFDARLRRVIDPTLAELAVVIRRLPVTANEVTIGGFLVGVLSVPLLAINAYGLAIVVIVINRFLDGLDGAVARDQGVTDAGGYLDIVLDFIFYSAVVFGFALGQPESAVAAAFLIFSFIGTGSSFLAFAIFAEKHGLSTDLRGPKSIYYLGGLTEGFETLVVLLLFCLIPEWFDVIAIAFGCLCWVTTATRVLHAYRVLSEAER